MWNIERIRGRAVAQTQGSLLAGARAPCRTSVRSAHEPCMKAPHKKYRPASGTEQSAGRAEKFRGQKERSSAQTIQCCSGMQRHLIAARDRSIGKILHRKSRDK